MNFPIEILTCIICTENRMLFKQISKRLNHYRVQLTALAIILSFVLCFLPFWMHWTNITIESMIIDVINTRSFQFSIIVGIAVAAQGIIDTTLDLIGSVARNGRHKEFLIGFVPRFLILLALIFPNIIIFVIGIPLQNPKVVLIFFQSQYTIALMSVIVNLWMIGGPSVRSNHVLFLGIFTSIRNTLGCYHPFSGPNYSLIFYIRIFLLFVMGICVIIILLRWYSSLKRKPFMKWSGNEITVTGYLLTFNVVAMSLAVAGYAFDSNTYSLPNMIYTQYHMAFCTILLSALQGRINRHETFVIEVR